MILSPVVLMLAAAAPAPQSHELRIEPPIQMSVQGVGAERTLAEFMDVCVRPRWNVAVIKTAVQTSDLAYAEDQGNESSGSLAWKSPRGFLSLNLNPAFSQCALSIGTIQPRTGQQLLAMLKPAVEAELGHAVQQNDAKFYLQWTDKESGFSERITLEGAGAEAKQAIWYLFDRAAPGAREKLEELARSAKGQRQ